MNVPLFKVFMAPEAKENVAKVLDSGFVGQGPKVEEFEQILRTHFGVHYVNTVNSATSGLHLAIHLLNLTPDDEILTTPLTCTATNFAILANKVKLRWVDVDPVTCNMDLNDLERKISHNTKAIMLVHWGGNPCDLNKVKEITQKANDNFGFKPIVIEDCAHAWGATYSDQLIGTHGNICVFSFQAIKHLTTGDGGVLICPNEALHKRAKLLRWYGLDRTSSADFRCEQNIQEWGYKFHMNDIAASIGIANYPYVENLVNRHRDNASFYHANINGVEHIPYNHESAYWVYTIHVEDRGNFIRKLKSKGIDVSQVHERNDNHACLKQYKTLLPGLDHLSKTMICIPCGWWITDEQRDFVVQTIQEGW